MEWLLDPTIGVGFVVLLALQLVLGLDNLLFVAILADKLPANQHQRARIMGLTFALVLQLVLLAALVALLQFDSPLWSVRSWSMSVRDLTLLGAGVFLMFKSTLALLERFAGKQVVSSQARAYSRFGVVLAQMLVLNAVFSLDAAVTAIGLLDQLSVLLLAGVTATVLLLVFARPMMAVVESRPSLVVLCWGSLLLIGLSLALQGVGVVVPRQYVYSAIVFAMVIEWLNGLARPDEAAARASGSLRERTAEAILRLLGHQRTPEDTEEGGRGPRKDRKDRKDPTQSSEAFGVEERNMVSGVLTLADRTVRSIMTPRTDVSWININDDPDVIRQQIERAPHSFFPVCRDNFDNIIGIGRAKRMITDLLTHGHIRQKRLREPLVVHDTISIIRLIDTLKHAKGQLVLVANEFGTIEGLVTPIDVFEAIAGEFPDEDETPDIVPDGENRWRIDGAADLHLLEQVLQTDGLVNEDEDYTTLAGYLLNHFGQLPSVGDCCEIDSPTATFTFRVARLERRRIAMVHVEKSPKTDESPTGDLA
jgi:CBS domain containing-hemolysin-like protein